MKAKVPSLRRLAADRDTSHFWRVFFGLSVPIVLQHFFGAALTLIDNIMVGRLGDSDVAGVGIANQVSLLFNLYLMGVAGGSAMFIAQFWGKKDVANIRKVLGLSFVLAAGFSLVLLGAIWLFDTKIIQLFSTDPSVVAKGAIYLKLIAFSYPLYALSTAYAACLRSIEKPRVPLVAYGIGVIMNTALNYVLIYGHFGFPRMGVSGSAIATLIARVLECAIILVAVHMQRDGFSISWRDVAHIDLVLIKRFFSQSGLLIFKDVMWAVGMALSTMIYARLGTHVIAAMNITDTVRNLTGVFFIGVATACQIVVANRIGANDTDTAVLYAKRFLWVETALSVALGMVLIAGRDLFILPYSVSAPVIESVKGLLFLYGITMPLYMTNMVMVVGVMRSGGDTLFCIGTDMVAVFLIGLPLAYLGAIQWGFRIEWVLALTMLQELFKIVVLFWRFNSGKWVRSLVHDL